MQRIVDGLWNIWELAPTVDAALVVLIVVLYTMAVIFLSRRGGGAKRKDVEAIIREAVEGQVDAHFQFDKIRDICDRMADDAHRVKHIADQAAHEAYEDALDILQQEYVAEAVNENRHVENLHSKNHDEENTHQYRD